MGQAIGGLATDDALMVIGTALDDSIKEEMRVTVVATGLGERRVQSDPDMRLVKSAEEGGSGKRDYRDYEQPTVFRAQSRTKSRAVADASKEEKEDFLNIPAFLKRQAD